MSGKDPIDNPLVAGAVFFPRPDMPFGPVAANASDHFFEVEEAVNLRLRVYFGPPAAPTILFFHGNGETAKDYDGTAASFNRLPVTLVAAEYRGYGSSGGNPTLNNFLVDAHACLDETLRLLADQGRSTRVLAMGRSLGSAPAIELAASRAADLVGLIVESGFARIVPLLKLLGIPVESLGITEEHGPRNEQKIATVALPTLIIHAENDMIIPLADAEALFEASADAAKVLVRVPRAGHNDIHFVAGDSYFDAIAALIERL